MIDARIGPFPEGMNNRQPSHALPEGTVRNLVNADIDNAGHARRRDGSIKVYSGMQPRFGFDCPAGEFFVEGPHIKQFNADNTATIIWSGVTGSYCTFYYFNMVLYFSDGVVALKIRNNVVARWGMARPPAPTMSAMAGTYPEGRYLAACCWVDADGVESAASPIVELSVADNSGFYFGNLPNPTDPQIQTLRLYLSAANGRELYHVADTTSSDYSLMAGRYDGGMTMEQAFMMPAPAGRIIRQYNGRMLIADAYGVLWYSDPYQPDHFRPSNNEQFITPLAIMEPVDGGIYLCTEKETMFYVGDPEPGFQRYDKFDYGAILGTGRRVPDSSDVVWQSQRGMIKASADGSCVNQQEKNVAVESAASGATLVRAVDGLKQYLASLQNPTTSGLAARSWIDAEVIRRSA